LTDRLGFLFYRCKCLCSKTVPLRGVQPMGEEPLQGVILRGIVGLLKDDLRLLEALQMKDASADRSHEVMKRAAALAGDLMERHRQRQRELVLTLLNRVTLQAAAISVEIRLASLLDLLDPQRPSLELGANGDLTPKMLHTTKVLPPTVAPPTRPLSILHIRSSIEDWTTRRQSSAPAKGRYENFDLLAAPKF
jgi:hypothetical protein